MSRSLFRFFVSVLLTTICVSNIVAQRDNDPLLPGSFFEVSGQIRSSNNQIVSNVMVRIETASGALVDQGQTDSMGRFRFARLRQGQYKVSAKANGLVAPSQIVDLSRSSPRVHVLLQLVPETATFKPRAPARAGIIDARAPAPARTEIERARSAIAEKKHDDALVHLQRAIALYPDFYEAYALMGDLYTASSQWDKAETAFRNALRVNPKSVTSMVSLAEVYRRQKKHEQGQKLLEDALKLDNNSWETNFTLGRIYWELKDIAKAGKYIAKTIELQPNLPEARLLAGNIFLRAGLPNNALVEYEEYLKLAPNGEFAEVTKELVHKIKKSVSKQ